MASTRTRRIAQLAILAAIIILMAFTPLGFLKVGMVEITFLIIPVAVGAIALGPSAGAILGGIFGVCSFIQAAGGLSYFGAALFAVSPLSTALVCLIPRVACGWLSGLVFKWVYPHDRTRLVSFGLGGLVAALSNTVLFMALLLPLFGNCEYMKGLRGGMSLMAFILAFVGVNGAIEAGVGTVVSAAVGKAVVKYSETHTR